MLRRFGQPQLHLKLIESGESVFDSTVRIELVEHFHVALLHSEVVVDLGWPDGADVLEEVDEGVPLARLVGASVVFHYRSKDRFVLVAVQIGAHRPVKRVASKPNHREVGASDHIAASLLVPAGRIQHLSAVFVGPAELALHAVVMEIPLQRKRGSGPTSEQYGDVALGKQDGASVGEAVCLKAVATALLKKILSGFSIGVVYPNHCLQATESDDRLRLLRHYDFDTMQGPGAMQLMHQMTRDGDQFRNQTINKETRRRVWSFAKPYKGMIISFLLTLVAASVLAVLPPLLFRQIIDVAIIDRNRGYLDQLAIIIVIAAFAAAGLALLERWWSARIGEGLIFDLRSQLYDHVQRMPLAFFTRSQTGTLISRLNNDVIGAQRAFTGTLGSVVSNLISLGTTMIAMFYLEWRLTLLSLVLLPLFILPAKRVGRGLQNITREGMELNATMNNNMTERFNVSGALLVKLFGNPVNEQTVFSDRAGRVRDIGIRSAMYSRTFMIALSLVGAVGTAAVYWIGGRLAISDDISIGTLAALSLYVVRIYGPLTSLTGARVDIMSAYVSFERVFEILDTPNPIIDKVDALELGGSGGVRGQIDIEHLSFGYPEDGSNASFGELGHDNAPTEMVLHDINLSVPAGSMVAIVGPSGAGKSTLTSLLPRLHDVTEGVIKVDGHDVRDVTQQSLRDAIGVVSQDPHMFHDTVAANLRFSNPEATDAEMHAAAEAARISKVIEALPEGYDTVVGERGYRLSGGEKQRLAIARMLLKNPRIVILDEATSHLDTENEALVQQALAVALDERTSIVIAHRLSTITSADIIVVLDKGRIVEQGTHDELIAEGGLYSELYEILVATDQGVIANK